MTVHSVRIILYLNELLLKWRTDSERLKSIVAPLIRARSVVQVHPGPPLFSRSSRAGIFELTSRAGAPFVLRPPAPRSVPLVSIALWASCLRPPNFLGLDRFKRVVANL